MAAAAKVRYPAASCGVSDLNELDEDDISMEFAACGILAGYYYRTSDTDIKGEPKIQEESKRIFSDYHFIKENPEKESFQKRMAGYKKILLV